MDPTRPNKRRRLIASCAECHRRKQKCDRQKPCSTCIARNKPDSCSYGDSSLEQTDVSNAAFQTDPFFSEPQNSGYHDSVYQTPVFPVETPHNVQIDPQLLSIENSVLETQALPVSLPEETKPVETDEDDMIDPLLRETDPTSQFGYSLTNGNNAIVSKQLLSDEDGFPEFSGSATSSHDEAISARYWRLSRKLPGIQNIENLIDLHFAHVNWQYSHLERYHFNELFEQWKRFTNSGTVTIGLQAVPTDVKYFPALLFQTMALALQFLPPDSTFPGLLETNNASSYDHLAHQYSIYGTQLLDILGRHHTCVVAVQHDFLKAALLKNFGRITEAWHSLGNAIRQAQEIGLHRQSTVQQNGTGEVERTLAFLWQDEVNRRLWVNLFVWDAQMAMILGRARSINVDDCNIKTPIDCDIPKNPLKTVPMPIQPDEKPSAFSERLLQYGVANKIHEMRRLGVDRRHIKDYTIVQSLHTQILSLLDSVPPSLRLDNPDTSWDAECSHLPLQREQITTTINAYLIGLHRPHVVDHTESCDAVWDAASAVLQSQQKCFEKSDVHVYKNFMLSFFTVDAALLLSAMAIRFKTQNEARKRRLTQDLKEAISRLQILKEKSPIAKSGLTIISRCCQKVWSTYDIRGSPGLDSSPVSAAELYTADGGRSLQNKRSLEPEQINSNATSGSSMDGSLGWSEDITTDFDPSCWLDQLNQIDTDMLDDLMRSVA